MASNNFSGDRRKWAASVNTASQVNKGYGSERTSFAAHGVNGSRSRGFRKAATSGPDVQNIGHLRFNRMALRMF